jgi:hypothetical protein
MTSMDRFNKCAAEIFSLLYEKFPIGTDLDIQTFPAYDDPVDSEIFFATIDFLDGEGFINCNDRVYGGYRAVVLTAKGFTVLNSTPEAISGKSTLGDEIKNVLKAGKDEGIKAVIREIVRLFAA